MDVLWFSLWLLGRLIIVDRQISYSLYDCLEADLLLICRFPTLHHWQQSAQLDANCFRPQHQVLQQPRQLIWLMPPQSQISWTSLSNPLPLLMMPLSGALWTRASLLMTWLLCLPLLPAWTHRQHLQLTPPPLSSVSTTYRAEWVFYLFTLSLTLIIANSSHLRTHFVFHSSCLVIDLSLRSSHSL